MKKMGKKFKGKSAYFQKENGKLGKCMSSHKHSFPLKENTVHPHSHE